MGLEPAKSQSTASTLLLSPFGSILFWGCTKYSLFKFECRLNHVIGSPKVFKIWRPPGGPLVTLYSKSISYLMEDVPVNYAENIYWYNVHETLSS